MKRGRFLVRSFQPTYESPWSNLGFFDTIQDSRNYIRNLLVTNDSIVCIFKMDTHKFDKEWLANIPVVSDIVEAYISSDGRYKQIPNEYMKEILEDLYSQSDEGSRGLLLDLYNKSKKGSLGEFFKEVEELREG